MAHFVRKGILEQNTGQQKFQTFSPIQPPLYVFCFSLLDELQDATGKVVAQTQLADNSLRGTIDRHALLCLLDSSGLSGSILLSTSCGQESTTENGSEGTKSEIFIGNFAAEDDAVSMKGAREHSATV
ncbi:unnamed protein product [Cyclocybe aegerita]|uniref:Uncharacterized protein n=1 Tax=Cyclocybe aegerita TaxID=1973307 RepID=A0A8S0W5Q7_CYCAE|nr:unnamed protein product [Cyclocybe aegerita]